MKQLIICSLFIGLTSVSFSESASAFGGRTLGRWTPPSTGIPFRSPFRFRPRESDNHLPSNVNNNGRSSRRRKKVRNSWASPESMRNEGYRQYNDVRLDNYRNVYIGGNKVGRGKVRKNSRGGYYVDYRTKNGARIIKQANGKVWVRPGLQFDDVVTRKIKPNRSNSGGRNLGTFNINSYRQRRFGR